MLAGYGMNKDNRAKTASELNALWDDGEVSVRRATSEIAQYHDRRLSMSWLVQPDAARETLGDPLLSNMGFWPRFLLAWPAPGKPRTARRFDPQTSKAIADFRKRCRDFLDVPQKVACDDLPVIEPDPLAQAVFDDFFERMEQESKTPGGRFEPVKAFAVRATELAYRIAAILAVFRGDWEIQQDIAKCATALAEYSVMTWLRIRGDAPDAADQRHALKIYQWLLKRPGACSAERSMLHVGPKLRSKEARDAALAILESLGCVARSRDSWFATPLPTDRPRSP